MSLTEELTQEINKLPKPSDEVFTEIHEKKEAIVSDLNSALLTNKKLIKYSSEDSPPIDIINQNNFFLFLESFTQKKYNPELIVKSILWIYKSYMKSGYDPNYWKIFFKAYVRSIKANTSQGSFKELKPFFSWIKKNHGKFLAVCREE